MTVSVKTNTTGGGYPPAYAGCRASPNFIFQTEQRGSSDCYSSEHKCKEKSTVLHLCPGKKDLTYEVKIYEQDKQAGSV